MATPRPKKPSQADVVELMRDRDSTARNLQASIERTEQYRRRLESLEAFLSYVS
jgi:hypothetical protein